MRFGVAMPTATEGMMYPIPYADIEQAVELAVAADRMGYDSVWGNDHVSTQAYVRSEFEDPPRFYDPITYLTFVAAKAPRIKIGTAVMVLPFRHPVVAAKQIATLDQLSNGRLILGVGIGAYREEFAAMWRGRNLHRGDYTRECIEALQSLFDERRSSYEGTYISFEDVESYPKPVQDPLPILSGGNAPGTRQRAGALCQGWMPACLTVDEISSGMSDIERVADEHDRELPPDFDVALQVAVSIGATHEAAIKSFEASQIYAHTRSLSKSTLKGKQADYQDRNLIGTADGVAEQIAAYRDAGVTTMAALLFTCDTVPETIEAMEEFANDVIPVLGQ